MLIIANVNKKKKNIGNKHMAQPQYPEIVL